MQPECSNEEGASGTEPASLQDAFSHWRRSKLAKAQSRTGQQPSSPDAARKQQLRRQFVDIARSYIGVPYCQRAHDPVDCACEGCTESGRKLYDDPSFVDCCALVRIAVRKMRDQLGVRIGPMNQAYQFDTLPVRVDSLEELEPGDLIFYSGKYFNPETTQHPFGMTHVEIFIGGSTGEATIGSRERFKWVKEYDTYKFNSKRWSLISCFFCKLDPWLEGNLQPQHPELWREPWGTKPAPAGAALSWNSQRFSLFQHGGAGDEDADGQGAQDSW